MSYRDKLTSTLRPYDLTAAPLVSIAAEVYPLAHAGLDRLIGGIGVTGDYERAFGLSSADKAGGQVGTQWQSFDFGLRERVVINPSILLGADLGYGAVDFQFDRPSFTAQLPSVGYRFIRAGIDVRATHGDLSGFAGGGYLFMLSAGDMGGLFPRESVGGIEGRIGGAYALTPHFELSLALSYARFFFSMHPEPGDPNVAGGALDEMSRLSLGVSYLL
jgi:hypothetical protein